MKDVYGIHLHVMRQKVKDCPQTATPSIPPEHHQASSAVQRKQSNERWQMTEKAKHLIIVNESLNQPYKFPGGESGVTIGYGYDLGQCTGAQFVSDWSDVIPEGWIDALRPAIGKRAEAAKKMCPFFKAIAITPQQAMLVFDKRMAPQYEARTARAFPGLQNLPPDAQGALVSLVFNRGASMEGERRKEMREVRDCVARHDLKGIAAAIRRMKRLWVGQGLDGLLKRREDEAKLVESCL